MLRLPLTLCTLIALAHFTCGVRADDTDADNNKGRRGEISNVDSQAGTLTVKMRDRDGKEIEKTFKLARETRFLDADGKPTEVSVFHSGDQIVLLAQKGDLNELRQAGRPVQAEILDVNPTAGTVRVRMKDENGKDVERTFQLTGEIRYMDSLGRAVDSKIFRAGDQVAMIVNKGQLQEISKTKR